MMSIEFSYSCSVILSSSETSDTDLTSIKLSRVGSEKFIFDEFRKLLDSKTPLGWLKIGLIYGQKTYAYIFVNTPEKLICKPPYKFLQPEGQRRGWGNHFWSISNRIAKVGVDATC